MNRWRAWFLPLALFGLLLAAVGWLFNLRLGGGEVYPLYSSLRADALGTRALYEALAQMPGVTVARDFRPVEKIEPKPRLVVLPGLHWQAWADRVPAEKLTALKAAANNGARVVLAFVADQIREDRDEHGRPVRPLDEPAEKPAEETKKGADKKKREDAPKLNKLRKLPGIKEREFKELSKEWGVTLKTRWLTTNQEGAQRATKAPAELPPTLAWHSDLYFELKPESGWQVLYRRAGEAVMIEKKLGRGSLVLMADAYGLSNEAMQRDRAADLIAWLVGEQRTIVFSEGGLGVVEERGIGHLARRYGLGGAMALTALLGLLYAWRRFVPLLPPDADESAEAVVGLAYEPAAGVTGLLRRSLPVAEWLPACVAEWHRGQRPGANMAGKARLEKAWAAHDPKKPLTETYNELGRALKPH